ncbi:MAG: hypothetical protein LBT27_02445 [Prevotellaceae bacterium]|jgi:hypothetical protein|nr:hypothetical protein [Prevotellaceae bacterium]
MPEAIKIKKSIDKYFILIKITGNQIQINANDIAKCCFLNERHNLNVISSQKGPMNVQISIYHVSPYSFDISVRVFKTDIKSNPKNTYNLEQNIVKNIKKQKKPKPIHTICHLDNVCLSLP